MCVGFVGVRVDVGLASVPVHVRMDDPGTMRGSKTFRDPARRSAQVQDTQQDQHQPHRQLHG